MEQWFSDFSLSRLLPAPSLHHSAFCPLFLSFFFFSVFLPSSPSLTRHVLSTPFLLLWHCLTLCIRLASNMSIFLLTASQMLELGTHHHTKLRFMIVGVKISQLFLLINLCNFSWIYGSATFRRKCIFKQFL